jgi:hypothetical protein
VNAERNNLLAPCFISVFYVVVLCGFGCFAWTPDVVIVFAV